MPILPFSEMPFNSKRTEISDGTDPASFGADLAASVDEWKAAGTTAVWISCTASAADCIPAAAALGFTFHQ